MQHKFRYSLLILFLLFSFNISAQNLQKIDSLLKVLMTTGKDTNAVRIYNNLSKEYCNNDGEKAMQYANLGIEIANKINDKKGLSDCYNNIGHIYYYQSNNDEALKNYNKALKLREEINDRMGIAISYMNIGNIYFNIGDYSKSIDFTTKSLKISEAIDDKIGVCSCLMNIGNIYSYQSDFSKALDYYEKALKSAQELGDKEIISNCYLNIGIVYSTIGDYAPAIENYQKALKIKEELHDNYGVSNCLASIGNLQVNQGNYESALEYFKKSIEISESAGNKSNISNCLMSIGNIMDDQQKYNTAIEYYQKALKLNEESNDKNCIAASLNNLGTSNFHLGRNKLAMDFYNKSLKIKKELDDKEGISLVYINIANLKFSENKIGESIDYAQKAYSIAKEIGSKENMVSSSGVLANSYAMLGNYKSAYEFQTIFKIMNDSIFNEESSKQVKQMEARYQNEKKQQQIELQNIQIDKKEAEVSRQRTQKIAFIVGFLLMMLFAVVIFKNYKEKKKANILLSIQRDEIQKQRDEISSQKKEITDSIHYAKRIQNALLMQHEFANDLLGDHFILMKPKAIVSGDFYWITKIDHQLIFAVADCTGHGVPGGFMSMLGIAFLNEIVNKEKITQPALILNELRTNIITSLKQKGVSLEQKDGMDIALCNLDLSTYKLQYAAAYNPLYYVSHYTGELTVIKADKMPVSIHISMEPFTNHQIQLSKGDIIYLFSDGFEDQFGGPKGKRFLASQVRQMLIENCQKPMIEQKEIYDNRIEDWKNNYKTICHQTDDITVMGIKI